MFKGQELWAHASLELYSGVTAVVLSLCEIIPVSCSGCFNECVSHLTLIIPMKGRVSSYLRYVRKPTEEGDEAHEHDEKLVALQVLLDPLRKLILKGSNDNL